MSSQYDGNRAPLLWECGTGHQWRATLNNVKDGHSWCPFCANKRHLGLPLACAVANSRGGECLSDDYKNSFSPLQWKCEHGHTWWAHLNNVKNAGSWCPICAISPLTLADAKEIAAERGGELLSQIYSNVRSKLKWKCVEGHQWLATLASVKNAGSWCPSCAHGRRRHSIALAYELASQHGGACVSEAYKNNISHLSWRCAKGHEWWATLKAVKNQGSWCPSCASGRREREVRDVYGPWAFAIPCVS